MDIELTWKPIFIERYSKLTNIEIFKKISSTYLKRSIRVNTLKTSINEIKTRLKLWNLKQIPWCKEGFWIESERRDIGNTLEHTLGYIYVQEAASMIPVLILDPKPKEFILDMAAAPGSKTTQIASLMKNSGLLIANDYKRDRMKPLTMNLQRSGITNTVTTLMEGRFFKNFKFDRILLDAPCSATGAIRKSPRTTETYNINTIKRIVGTQKQLILTAFDNLKEKGTLVYSTCSLEPEENEGVINHLLENRSAEIQEITFKGKRSDPILKFEGTTYNPEIKKCLRIWPQDNDTEGFFVAKITKP